MKNLFAIGVVIAVLALPFVLRPKQNLLAAADDTLVLISPHNEAIRYEFTRAFSESYHRETGRTVRLDWRTPGGGSEIARYIKSEFYNSFENYWRSLGRAWTPEVIGGFDNPRMTPAASPAEDFPAQAARRSFLDSSVGIGIDIMFGGGSFDFIQQADAGRLVAGDVMRRHPEWFSENSIPQSVSGEIFYDPKGRWIGAALSSFGICYNRDSLRRLGVMQPPTGWENLADPVYRNEVALTDPSKSGSAAKAFEMILQQKMQQAGEDRLGDGWAAGLNLIQAAAANARYFTDAAGRVPMDVAAGDAAIGMCIDFYGRFQSEYIAAPDGESRLVYVTPSGGSSVGVDPIAILRGAPNRAVAERFVEFVLSIEGQKLWNFRVGTPGGPQKYALRRLPIRKELYAPEYTAFRSDPTVFPYEDARLFTYHAAWTAPLFRAIGLIVKVMTQDSHDELADAWKALIAAGFPPEATQRFYDVSLVDYSVAREKLRPILSSPDRIAEVALTRELTDAFRRQYREAAQLAREGK
ncbi:extracellular solute-binding protein [Terrimicrobium sacchariphilum]|uniref:Extracellular solute-binding protein n=1 Tax=Terrimicrobium sacchariphilum TaxID=690879 RepID=A0A146G848_TERSA|nr:extracellular solute-binding protein [Terrimicrobium sacchariphilum]GAT33680.1 extracellular solute-binding protein [Terrimicrobium sacchariphilum]